jgi:ribosomal protein L37E
MLILVNLCLCWDYIWCCRISCRRCLGQKTYTNQINNDLICTKVQTPTLGEDNVDMTLRCVECGERTNLKLIFNNIKTSLFCHACKDITNNVMHVHVFTWATHHTKGWWDKCIHNEGALWLKNGQFKSNS